MGSLPVSRLLPQQSAHTGGCSASLAIVDGLNEFHRRGELHPPIALLPTQPAGVEIIDVLNGGQQAGRVCLEGRRRGDGRPLGAQRSSWNSMQIKILNMFVFKSMHIFTLQCNNVMWRNFQMNNSKKHKILRNENSLRIQLNLLYVIRIKLTLMRTKTRTGTKSSAPGTESSLAKLRRFMMVEHIRRIHWTLSRGVL